MNYIDLMVTEQEAFSGLDFELMQIHAITPDNMILLMQSRDIEGYNAFYEENYGSGS